MRLIDAIEAAAASSTGMYSDACDLMQSDYWPRIKAALEAGEEMAKHSHCVNDEFCREFTDAVTRFLAAAGEGS